MYVSIEYDDLDEFGINKVHPWAIVKRKQNTQFPFYVEFNHGDWIILNINPKLILTEKFNAWIKMNTVKKNLFNSFIQYYTITKFMLLKIIIKCYLIDDLLFYIVDLSD